METGQNSLLIQLIPYHLSNMMESILQKQAKSFSWQQNVIFSSDQLPDLALQCLLNAPY